MGIFDFLKSRHFLDEYKSDNALKLSPATLSPVVLLSLDGWGMAPPSHGNAVHLAKTPNMDFYPTQYPRGQLIASGESVGLPANEVGNSEVGHLTMGSGYPIPQSIRRISLCIEDDSFNENQAFISAAYHVAKNQSKLHIMGLASSGGVHSSLNHLYALLDFCRKKDVQNVILHLFTDGRDAPPKDAINVIEAVENKIKSIKVGQIATISGRYYAMDRDRRWERTKKVYDAMVLGRSGVTALNARDAILTAYNKGQTDEFIEPTIIVKQTPTGVLPIATVDDRDAAIFFNFRIDRPRQLTMAFVLPNFEKLKTFEFGFDPEHDESKPMLDKEVVSGPTFKREKKPEKLYFVTMTEYQENLPVGAVAFPPETAKEPLPKILSGYNLHTLCLAESEKERMVTYYFNGMRSEMYPNEEALIIPSPKVPTYDKKPEMSVFKLVEEFKKAVSLNKFAFYIINFANPDMVAHSGNLQASIKACEFTDKAVGELVNTVLQVNGTVFITADHGNVEELLSFPSTSYYFTTSQGNINTEHSNNPVPLIIISNSLRGKAVELPKGTLSDIAPTILGMMNIPVPSVMTGTDLLKSSHP